ncbi:CheB methylesterase domain-containing protein [Planctomicrobium sp. SH668]|uniref:CheB methylesterase domain-containing protein n=1 Tax=Planctomicrobium sp. SH668 TaxID=3448126 RepID=UPI003F5B4F30
MPRSFPVPIVIVQHMPPVFTQLLANRLNQLCSCEVREAVDEEALNAGEILIAPGDRHLEIVAPDGIPRVQLNDGPMVNSCRPAVDILFRSVAKLYGRQVLSVVLTGMGKDGLEGARAIKQAGGTVIAQDQETSVVWGMPRAVTEAGLADRVVALPFVSKEILNSVSTAENRVIPTYS